MLIEPIELELPHSIETVQLYTSKPSLTHQSSSILIRTVPFEPIILQGFAFLIA